MDRQNAAFEFRGIAKTYTAKEGDIVRALQDITFVALSGQITCIAGPTGSGKTTLLRIASGIEHPDAGTVCIDGKSPGERQGQIGYISQHHTLLPWLRVRENMALPLTLRGSAKTLFEERISELSSLLGLRDALSLYPYELSGGMQQRAALGRLLAGGYPYWLMDEPFSSLDDRTRQQIQRLLTDLAQERRLSVLFVTHQLDEAVFLADKVVILSERPGRAIHSFDIAMSRPRNRLSSEFGEYIERIRMKIESVLDDEKDVP